MCRRSTRCRGEAPRAWSGERTAAITRQGGECDRRRVDYPFGSLRAGRSFHDAVMPQTCGPNTTSLPHGTRFRVTSIHLLIISVDPRRPEVATPRRCGSSIRADRGYWVCFPNRIRRQRIIQDIIVSSADPDQAFRARRHRPAIQRRATSAGVRQRHRIRPRVFGVAAPREVRLPVEPPPLATTRSPGRSRARRRSPTPRTPPTGSLYLARPPRNERPADYINDVTRGPPVRATIREPGL